jgi:drug/metabolite transporter (DMT)-like permease
MAGLGKLLVVLGLVLAILGAALWAVSYVPFVGRLPGDIYIKGDNFTFYFPLTTCILLSIVLSLMFWMLRR